MQKIRDFFHYNFPEARRRDTVFWLLIALAGVFFGLLVTIFTFREGLDFGDGSTFYQFAHNLFHGEVIYKDFIHFRTPGSYFLQALFLNIMGDHQSSLRFALLFESYVLYPLIFTIGMALFLRFKHALIGASTVLVIIALPAYAQLRTVIAFLAVVLYIQAYRITKGRRAWLIASGIVTGIAFTFGQEAALMAILTIGIIELSKVRRANIKERLINSGWLLCGFFAGVLPLLLYVLIFSSVGTFLYYTLYYAFILQPQGMDLIYPSFDYGNFIFYLVFALYILIFCIFYGSKKAGLPEITLFIFALFRAITLLGRSDIGHLIFILPELLFLTILALSHFKSTVFNKQNSINAALYSLLFGISLYAAIRLGANYLIISAIIVAIAFSRRKLAPKKAAGNDIPLLFFFAISGAFAILIYIIYPSYLNTLAPMSTRGVTSMNLDGVNVDQPTYERVKKIDDAVAAYHPTTIFSYPIQPYFYHLAPKHAARFLTFEPQTTVKEQMQTIEDLKRTKPEVILYDEAQAESMENTLGKINAYIKDTYKIAEWAGPTGAVWIMVPKGSSITTQ
jgi:hypothetical protein